MNQKLEVKTLSTTTKYLAVIFVLIGIVLLAISVALQSGYIQEFLKELGIVVLSVFTVSIIYERLVAEKYLLSLQQMLSRQLESGEGIAAAALRLGIIEIFPSRDEFEHKYPFAELVATLKTGETIRVVARSIFLLMSKQYLLKEAIKRGVTVELCFVSPSTNQTIIAHCQHLEIPDIQSALNVFEKNVHEWVVDKVLPGSIEIRFHQIPSIDSNLRLGPISHPRVCVWDFSFGRDITAKRVFLVDPDKQLGKDLACRYDAVWNNAEKVYHYDGKNVTTNKLFF